jgi:hypothetical protein
VPAKLTCSRYPPDRLASAVCDAVVEDCHRRGASLAAEIHCSSPALPVQVTVQVGLIGRPSGVRAGMAAGAAGLAGGVGLRTAGLGDNSGVVAWVEETDIVDAGTGRGVSSMWRWPRPFRVDCWAR